MPAVTTDEICAEINCESGIAIVQKDKLLTYIAILLCSINDHLATLAAAAEE